MGVPSRVTAWAIVGSVLIVVAVGFLIFASAFPYWQERARDREGGFPNVGLWEICFREEGETVPAHAGEVLSKTFYGCNYIFDRNLRKIVRWYFTDWMIIVVLFVTLGLVLLPVAFVLNILYYVRVCSAHLEHYLLAGSTAVTWTEGFLCAIAIIVFGTQSDIDEFWIPNPKSNHLSYSFGLCAVVPVFCWFAGMCHAVEFMRLKSIKDRDARVKIFERGEFGRY